MKKKKHLGNILNYKRDHINHKKVICVTKYIKKIEKNIYMTFENNGKGLHNCLGKSSQRFFQNSLILMLFTCPADCLRSLFMIHLLVFNVFALL